ncbi:hypothetical protein SAMN05443144_12862 [Fodinibius roseus]|uniref:Uncharacterized protein n=2 Tax=Fodinibius roseus TaxID=1194090 RepID=A0A1M5JW92_9BACT|nr:hypothetical protein SAMN05443144_12862 [Fodinibius roseus]
MVVDKNIANILMLIVIGVVLGASYSYGQQNQFTNEKSIIMSFQAYIKNIEDKTGKNGSRI